MLARVSQRWHMTSIGVGEIGARDQRVGGKCAPLIGPQGLALPFRRPALGRGQPGARHRDLDRPERACQRPRAAAVAVARNAGSSFIASHLASPITRPCQRSVELAADQFFDEPTRASPHLGLDRIEPIVEKINNYFSRRDYATLNSYQLRDGTSVNSCPICPLSRDQSAGF